MQKDGWQKYFYAVYYRHNKRLQIFRRIYIMKKIMEKVNEFFDEYYKSFAEKFW